MHNLSVSALNEQIKNLLESSFVRVFVEAELSRITYHNTGHIYFSLKDENSSIKAVMFKGNATKLKFRLEEGQKVLVDGAISVYKPRGEYQLNCFSIEPSGSGALALAYEQLRKKLFEKGYFDQSRKKTLPKFPSRIALITSATGAALQDMLRVAQHRYPLVKISVYDVLVQGESAALSIASAIKEADSAGYDIIVTGRGGGSVEDLWAFNEEIVADAIFNAKTPIVSAVGHEIDFLISDEVSDLRAPTPSAAMQMILPDQNELLIYISQNMDHLNSMINEKIYRATQRISALVDSFRAHSIDQKIKIKKDDIVRLKESFAQSINYKLQILKSEIEPINLRLNHRVQNILDQKRNVLTQLQNSIESQHPKYKNKKGFVQLSKNSKVIDLDVLKKDDQFEIMDEKLIVTSQVIKIKNI